MNMKPNTRTPEQIKALRLRMGTQAQAEAATGIDQARWCDWETGKRTPNLTTQFGLDRIEWLLDQAESQT